MVRNEIGELKSEMNSLENRIDSKIDNKIGGLENRMNGKFNLVLNSQDEVLKRLEDLETDNTIGVGASRWQEDKLENHEGRIVIVEEKLGVGRTV
ncbi:MAG: hypothetical protein U9N04_04315 [Patescibacteria group bacterium]|nr:hypothetical protein [Patescibacteria group bacterium]